MIVLRELKGKGKSVYENSHITFICCTSGMFLCSLCDLSFNPEKRSKSNRILLMSMLRPWEVKPLVPSHSNMLAWIHVRLVPKYSLIPCFREVIKHFNDLSFDSQSCCDSKSGMSFIIFSLLIGVNWVFIVLGQDIWSTFCCLKRSATTQVIARDIFFGNCGSSGNDPDLFHILPQIL